MDWMHDFSDAELKVCLYDGVAAKRTMLLDGRHMVKIE